MILNFKLYRTTVLGSCAAYFLGIFMLSAIATFAHADEQKELPQSTSRRSAGFYLSPRDKPGRVTTESPLGGNSRDKIVQFFEQHPELRDHRVVISIPSLLKGRELVVNMKTALRDLGLPDDVEVIRFPNGGVIESALDFLPRYQDLAWPLPEEIKTGHMMVFAGEALSISLLTYLVLTDQLTVAMGSAMVALDLFQQAIITYPVRALSLYQSRQSNVRQFLFNLLFGLFTSTNYFLLLNQADLAQAMPTFLVTVIPSAFVSAIWSNTAVTAFKWEAASTNTMPLEDRRIFRSRALLLQQLILSPFYIYEVAPFAKTLFKMSLGGVDLLNVNIGHLVIVGAGLGSMLTWPIMDRIAKWTSKAVQRPNAVGSCLRFFSKPWSLTNRETP